MGYIDSNFAAEGTEVKLMVRKRALDAKVASMPFVPQRYIRKP
jgi:aminomethyltransferase